jgi:hypothetical protein
MQDSSRIARRAKSKYYNAPAGKAWCAGHQQYHDIECFNRGTASPTGTQCFAKTGNGANIMLKRAAVTAADVKTSSASERVAAKQQEIRERKQVAAADKAKKAAVEAAAKAPARARIQVVSHSPVVDLPCPACAQKARYLKHASWCPKNPENRDR